MRKVFLFLSLLNVHAWASQSIYCFDGKTTGSVHVVVDSSTNEAQVHVILEGNSKYGGSGPFQVGNYPVIRDEGPDGWKTIKDREKKGDAFKLLLDTAKKISDLELCSTNDCFQGYLKAKLQVPVVDLEKSRAFICRFR